MDKKLELARKINELVKGSTGGEKRNAESRLKMLMDKYEISFDDIEKEAKSPEVLKCKFQNQFIMIQCVLKVMGADVKIFGHKKKKYSLIIDCTKGEFLEINAYFDFYSKSYQKELKYFNSSFVQKNNLLPPDGGDTDLSKLSKKEIEDVLRIHEMSKAINKEVFNKQITINKV